VLNLTDENGVKRNSTWIEPEAFALVLSNASVERVTREIEDNLQGVDKQQAQDLTTKLLLELKDTTLTIQNMQSLKNVATQLPSGDVQQHAIIELDDMIRVLTEYQAIPTEDHDARLALLRREIQNVNNRALRIVLASLLEAVDNFQEATLKIAAWFDNRVAESTKIYQRRMSQISFCIGLLVAITLNVDSLQIIQALWTDDELRQDVSDFVNDNIDEIGLLVAQSEAATAAANAETLEDMTAEEEAEQITQEVGSTLESINLTLELLNESGLPLGWTRNNIPIDALGYILKGAGWLTTALATTLGAPFWFDILRNLTRK
jgi:hypothetical protein